MEQVDMREPLNALNHKIRAALDLYPELRGKALKLVSIHAAGGTYQPGHKQPA